MYSVGPTDLECDVDVVCVDIALNFSVTFCLLFCLCVLKVLRTFVQGLDCSLTGSKRTVGVAIVSKGVKVEERICAKSTL